MDSLSAILKTIRLSSTIFCKAECCEPWSVHTNALSSGIFHAVVEGQCTLQLDEDGREVVLEAGDVVFLPHGHGHVMNAPARTPSVPIASRTSREEGESRGVLRINGPGAFTYLLCGSFVLEKSEVHPLFSLLPPVIHFRAEVPETKQWFVQTLSLLRAEVEKPGPGTDVFLNRMADVLLVRALRNYIEALQPGHGGWLRGLQDPQISRAMSLIHSGPNEAWTASTLARRVGMSRSGFFARFSALVGMPPKQYLTQWRMHVAARCLRREDSTVAEVAWRVGYASEGAFSRAFKRILGLAPSDYRRLAST
jgi:AraC-like DNA-binding protein